jgi:hypothetical protein
MKTVRYLAAGLLVLTGVVHVAQLLTGINGPTGITALFGVAYLVIAFYIYRGSKRIYWASAILPLLGLLFTLPTVLSAPTTLAIFFVVVDALVVACCAYLIYRSK